MDLLIAGALGLLIVVILVTIAARRLALPYTVRLVAAGAALALSRIDFGIVLTHDIIFEPILPPLLFEAAVNIHWHELRRNHLAEAAITVVVAYGAFLKAEYFHFSGVLATVTTGLVVGSIGVRGAQNRPGLSRLAHDFILEFWEFAAFLAKLAGLPPDRRGRGADRFSRRGRGRPPGRDSSGSLGTRRYGLSAQPVVPWSASRW